MNTHSREKGMSLVEILVAAAIISVSLVFIIQIAGLSTVFSRQSVNIYAAADYLEEGAEAVRTIRDNGWSNISSLSASTTYYLNFNTLSNSWSLSTTPSTLGSFTRTVTFAPVSRDSNYDIASSGTPDSNTDLVTVTVTRTESTGVMTKTLSFYLSNIFS